MWILWHRGYGFGNSLFGKSHFIVRKSHLLNTLKKAFCRFSHVENIQKILCPAPFFFSKSAKRGTLTWLTFYSLLLLFTMTDAPRDRHAGSRANQQHRCTPDESNIINEVMCFPESLSFCCSSLPCLKCRDVPAHRTHAMAISWLIFVLAHALMLLLVPVLVRMWNEMCALAYLLRVPHRIPLMLSNVKSLEAPTIHHRLRLFLTILQIH